MKLKLDYENPRCSDNARELKRFIAAADSDELRAAAFQEAIDLRLFVLDEEAHKVLENCPADSDAYVWAYVYGCYANWISHDQIVGALSSDHGALRIATLDTIGLLGRQEYASLVKSQVSLDLDPEIVNARERCLAALDDPSMVHFIYNPM